MTHRTDHGAARRVSVDAEHRKADAVAGAAADASERTVDAIERAAEENDDPAVAQALEEAATHAGTAATRVGWLRNLIRRVFG